MEISRTYVNNFWLYIKKNILPMFRVYFFTVPIIQVCVYITNEKINKLFIKITSVEFIFIFIDHVQ